MNIADLENKAKEAKAASKRLSSLSSAAKNQALSNIAEGLVAQEKAILAANEIDRRQAEAEGMGAAMIDRLLLNSERLRGMSEDVLTVAALPDPVGETYDMRTLANGLQVGKRRVPLGVIATIYESRPNVTVDIS
ncbi:MAG: gamma-glutamyl-phosphate reductase, partial [Chloroflexi bacterium]|nr:gamma-glutamyl-phosphate reductase [Chloroflexota bacterium]